MKRSLLLATVIFVLAGTAAFSHAADWPMFRGATRDGISSEKAAPLEWSSDKHVKWKAELPRPGNSSPVVLGDQVYVTTALDAKGTQRALICFDRENGKKKWENVVTFNLPDPTHATNPYCAPSPAADAECVIAWHGSAGLYCYDPLGKQQWKLDLGTIRHIWGFASSPVIHGDIVYVNAGPGARQFICAIDKKKGTVLWKAEEPGGAEDKSPDTGGWLGAWNSPRIVDVNGQEQLLMFMPFKVKAFNPKTGENLWSVEGAGPLAYSDIYISAPQVNGGRIGVAMAGYGGAAMGFHLGGEGDMTAKNRLWQSKANHPQRIGTGVVLGDRFIVPNEPYIGCYELATGKEVWKQAFPGERFWGGIVKVEDRLYLTSQSGTTYVFAADGASFKLLAKNALGEPSNSTPAVSAGCLFIRTAGHLWCIE